MVTHYFSMNCNVLLDCRVSQVASIFLGTQSRYTLKI